MPKPATTGKSTKLEKLDLDRSQLASILAQIHERDRLRNVGKRGVRPLPLFQPTTQGNRSNIVPLVEKLASRVYFSDRVKYGEGERVGRVSYENIQGQPFQLPHIENQQTYKWVFLYLFFFWLICSTEHSIHLPSLEKVRISNFPSFYVFETFSLVRAIWLLVLQLR